MRKAGATARSILFVVSAAALMLGLGALEPALADEPLFGFIYSTDLLPKGKVEAEQWVTLREGRSQGDFTLMQTRTELSYGLTSWFQLSGYLNFAYANAYHNTPSGETVPPEVFGDYTANPNSVFEALRFESASVEALVRILSPYTDPFGLALYVEPSVGPSTLELENRLILQKNFLDDRLVFAFNVTLGYELRNLPGDPTLDPADFDYNNHWDQETDVNFGLGVSYRFLRTGPSVRNSRTSANSRVSIRSRTTRRPTWPTTSARPCTMVANGSSSR
jgi:hypothetical protein